MSTQSAAKAAPAEQLGTALTPIERAKVALNSPEHEKKLAELAKASVSITAITNPAGYDQCHSARVALKKVRIDIERIGKGARADATAFSKAVIAEEARLIGIISPEEERLQKIQDAWDAAREAERQAKIAAEAARIAAINERIEWIRQQALDAAGESAVAIEERIQTLVALPIDGTFAELEKQAEGARATTLIRLRAALTKALALEGEQKRLAEERAENERVRMANEAAAKAERERIAEAQRLENESLARERARIAEQERIAKAAQDAETARQVEAQRLGEMRLQEIQGIQHQAMIAQMGRLGVREGGTRECIVETLAETEHWELTEEGFGPLLGTAQRIRTKVIEQIKQLLVQWDEQAEAERIRAENEAAAETERQRIAEANAAIQARIEAQEARERRIADERAQLARDQEALRVEREKPAPLYGEVAGTFADTAGTLQPVDEPAPGSGSVAPTPEQPFRPTNEAIINVLTTTYNVSAETVLTWLAELVESEGALS